mmetsp:Transcript_28138/g.45784  ORF Transcript_28138/g.45784 Transcript_28138/m.45784 type:complete len:618 (-) Transcript_28138:745-2598(-)
MATPRSHLHMMELRGRRQHQKMHLKRRFGMPAYPQWLSENETFRVVEKQLRSQRSIMTGRIRSLDEVRQLVIDQWKSPLAPLASCYNGLFWIEWGLFLFTLARFILNIIAVANNFAHRPCAFGDHAYCVPPKEGDNWVWFEYVVATTEGAGLLLLVILMCISILAFLFDCGYTFGSGRPRSLYLTIMAFGAITSFSMLSAVRLFQPHSVTAALRRTWTWSIPFLLKAFLSVLLLALIPISVVVVFAKLSQMEQVLVLHLDQWNVFPEYLIFLGFLNQLLGITDNIQSETSVVLDLLFLGKDARMSSQEAQQRDFILQTIYLETVGKWGWTGLIFMTNLGSTGWQKLFVTEDEDQHHAVASTELDLLLGPVTTTTNTSSIVGGPNGKGTSSKLGGLGGEGGGGNRQQWRRRRRRYGALTRNTSGGTAGRSKMMISSSGILSSNIDGQGGGSGGSSSSIDNKNMITFINTEAGTSSRAQSTQIMIVNDYTRNLRGYIEQLQEDGTVQRRISSIVGGGGYRRRRERKGAGNNNNNNNEEEQEDVDHDHKWHSTPGQVTVISNNIRAGAPYRLVVNVGDLAGDGKDGFVVVPFTTPNHGDAKLHLRAILNAKEIRFGPIDQ